MKMKKAMKLVSLVLAVVMLLGCLAACSSKSATTDSTASTDTASTDTAASDSSEASSDGGEIVIALISNTTGDYAQYGQPVRDGAMLYINQLNANGGINGKQVKVLEYDDKGDGVEAVNAYNLACDNGITAVFGATLTGPTIALADATYEDNMPQVTASATAAGVTMIDPDDANSEIRTNVFRACFIDPYQGEKMANYAVEKLSAKTAAVFYQTGNDYSEGLMNAFVEKAAELGLEIVDTEAFAEGDKDFKAQMTNIAGSGCGSGDLRHIVLIGRISQRNGRAGQRSAEDSGDAVVAGEVVRVDSLNAVALVIVFQNLDLLAVDAAIKRPPPDTYTCLYFLCHLLCATFI